MVKDKALQSEMFNQDSLLHVKSDKHTHFILGKFFFSLSEMVNLYV